MKGEIPVAYSLWPCSALPTPAVAFLNTVSAIALPVYRLAQPFRLFHTGGISHRHATMRWATFSPLGENETSSFYLSHKKMMISRSDSTNVMMAVFTLHLLPRFKWLIMGQCIKMEPQRLFSFSRIPPPVPPLLAGC